MARTIFRWRDRWVGLAASQDGIVRIVLPARSKRAVARRLGDVSDAGRSSERLIGAARAQLEQYLAGRRRRLTFPVDLSTGSRFQQRVWRAACRIPYGEVRSYQWLAERIGGRQYARAVGTALGSNCVPLAVPCHRIVAHDGTLGGFTGGLPLKRALLKLESTRR